LVEADGANELHSDAPVLPRSQRRSMLRCD
jgi:hypothetical protein